MAAAAAEVRLVSTISDFSASPSLSLRRSEIFFFLVREGREEAKEAEEKRKRKETKDPYIRGCGLASNILSLKKVPHNNGRYIIIFRRSHDWE